MGLGGTACPKTEPRKRVKARTQRHAATVVKSVREQCVERDGYCRCKGGVWPNLSMDSFDFPALTSRCDGPSEWAHFGEQKRFKTRGQAAERRHTLDGSLMLCQRHNGQYDTGRLRIKAKTESWTNGPLYFQAERSMSRHD